MDGLASDGSTDMKGFTLICHTAANAQPKKHQSPLLTYSRAHGSIPLPNYVHAHACAHPSALETGVSTCVRTRTTRGGVEISQTAVPSQCVCGACAREEVLTGGVVNGCEELDVKDRTTKT